MERGWTGPKKCACIKLSLVLDAGESDFSQTLCCAVSKARSEVTFQLNLVIGPLPKYISRYTRWAYHAKNSAWYTLPNS